jgi:hypothetical protein
MTNERPAPGLAADNKISCTAELFFKKYISNVIKEVLMSLYAGYTYV